MFNSNYRLALILLCILYCFSLDAWHSTLLCLKTIHNLSIAPQLKCNKYACAITHLKSYGSGILVDQLSIVRAISSYMVFNAPSYRPPHSPYWLASGCNRISMSNWNIACRSLSLFVWRTQFIADPIDIDNHFFFLKFFAVHSNYFGKCIVHCFELCELGVKKNETASQTECRPRPRHWLMRQEKFKI